MLQESRRQASMGKQVAEEDDVGVAAASVRKVDFSAVARKKTQTPKKKAAFTPLRSGSDVKPKFEPASPVAVTSRSMTPVAGEPAEAYVKTEPSAGGIDEGGYEDRKLSSELPQETDIQPDITGLEDLLSGLIIDGSHLHTPNRKPSASEEEMIPWTPVPVASKLCASSTPLFLPNDSPASSASFRSRQSSRSITDDFDSPPRPVREAVDVESPAGPVVSDVAVLNLFSDDSPPPPKREILSPARSASSDDFDDRHFSPSPSEMSQVTSPDQKALNSASPIRPTSQPLRTASAGPSRPAASKRRAFLDFLNQIEHSASEEEIAFDLGGDDSGDLGSLKDFIVDDDEEDYQSGENIDGRSDRGFSGRRPQGQNSNVPHKDMSLTPDDSDLEEIRELSRWRSRNLEPTDGPSDFDAVEDDVSEVSDDESDQKPSKTLSTEKRLLSTTILEDFLSADSDSDPAIDDCDDDLIDALDSLDVGATRPSRTKQRTKKAGKAPKWDIERVRIAQEVFDDLDKRVFDRRLGPDGAGAKIIWNKRLLTTAGTAQRKKRRQSDGTCGWDIGIQLSEKVCTGEEQILSTVAHEMCHLACWVIDNEFKNPHGKIFKSWGRKVMRKRSDLEVTTKHDYIIEYKFQWQCVGCKRVYKRHSKSIDIAKQGCGVCRGKLEPMFDTKHRVSNPFQLYLKQNMATAKAALASASHGEVMRALSARWAEAGPAGDHEDYWKTVLTASHA